MIYCRLNMMIINILFTSVFEVKSNCKSCFFYSKSGVPEPFNLFNNSLVKYPYRVSQTTYSITGISISTSLGDTDGYWCNITSNDRNNASFPCDLGLNKKNQPYCIFSSLGESCSDKCKDRFSNSSEHSCSKTIDCTFPNVQFIHGQNIANESYYQKSECMNFTNTTDKMCLLQTGSSVKTWLQCNGPETSIVREGNKCKFPYNEDGKSFHKCRLRNDSIFTTCPLNISKTFHSFYRFCSYTKYTNPNCIFPFYFNGSIYYECTKTNLDVFWCSPTKVFFKYFYTCENVANKYNRRCLYPFVSFDGNEYFTCSHKFRTWQNISWCSANYQISNQFYYCDNTDYSHVDCAFPFKVGGDKTSYYCVKNNNEEQERICPGGGEQKLTIDNAVHCASMVHKKPICKPALG